MAGKYKHQLMEDFALSGIDVYLIYKRKWRKFRRQWICVHGIVVEGKFNG